MARRRGGRCLAGKCGTGRKRRVVGGGGRGREVEAKAGFEGLRRDRRRYGSGGRGAAPVAEK